MESNKVGFTSIDEYIATFPDEIQKILKELRATIKAYAPDAIEKFSYGIPTFFLNGNLVHFAAFETHIGFYPTPSGIEAFKDELSIYKGAKGSVQFPIDKPLPMKLISKIVKFRVTENLKNAKIKSGKEFLYILGAPARRALEGKGITTLKQLSKFSESEILELHGIGPSSIPKLRSAMKSEGLSFKNK